MRYIVAYDESGYTGEYEYRYDPTHSNRPKGGGWYLTGHGWARGSDRGRGHVPSLLVHNPSTVQPSPELCARISRIADDPRQVVSFVSSDMTRDYAAADTVISLLGNHRETYLRFDRLIVAFADKKKLSVSHRLSTLMGYLFHLSPDFRNDRHRIPMYSPDTLQDVRNYMMSEQEILRMTGLANDDDTITLFRSTDHNQLSKISGELGEKVPYRGNNFESWTTNPDLRFSIDGSIKTTVTARIPISACVASCIGRRERPFMFKHRDECEVMVCGAFIRTVNYVGDSRSGVSIDSKRTYYGEVQSNMRRFAQRSGRVSPSKSAEMTAACKLIRIARKITGESRQRM